MQPQKREIRNFKLGGKDYFTEWVKNLGDAVGRIAILRRIDRVEEGISETGVSSVAGFGSFAFITGRATACTTAKMGPSSSCFFAGETRERNGKIS